jgi:hypothetical protein
MAVRTTWVDADYVALKMETTVFSPKCWYQPKGLHGMATQENVIPNVTV